MSVKPGAGVEAGREKIPVGEVAFFESRGDKVDDLIGGRVHDLDGQLFDRIVVQLTGRGCRHCRHRSESGQAVRRQKRGGGRRRLQDFPSSPNIGIHGFEADFRFQSCTSRGRPF